ncbi:MAG: agl cluster protein AglQ [Deltaproteobacteria bacterium]|nr:agl cluster protein AglQ [Deltaproteobacteria bacterium]
MTTTLFQFLHRCAADALEVQADDGSLPGGCNGPWADPETPVRNTGHWLIVFLRAFENSGDPRFRAAAHKAAAYLLSKQSRPMGRNFLHRTNPERDFCNGLIGPAWSIEALVAAGQALDLEEAFRASEEVFLLHPFLAEHGVWRGVNVDGSYGPIDPTFNHQLWFAASGSLVADATGNAKVRERVRGFMDHLDWSFQVRKNGSVRHGMRPRSLPKRLYEEFRILRQGRGYWKRQVPKETGYHAFNLMGFALLQTDTRDHPFWKTPGFAMAMQLIERDEYREELETSPYGYAYNPPGFEVPFAIQSFPDLVSEGTRAPTNLSHWIDRQLRKTWSIETRRMDRNTPDPTTLTARIYEACRLPDLAIGDLEDG